MQCHTYCSITDHITRAVHILLFCAAHLVTCLATMAYVYAVCALCLVQAGNSVWFVISWNTLLLNSPVLMHSCSNSLPLKQVIMMETLGSNVSMSCEIIFTIHQTLFKCLGICTVHTYTHMHSCTRHTHVHHTHT